MSCMNQEPEGIGRIDKLPVDRSSFNWSSRIVVPEEDLDDGLEDDLEAGVGEWAKVVRDGHPIAFGEAEQMWNNLLPLFVSAEVTQEGRNDLVLVYGIGDVWWSNSSRSLCVRQILVLTPIDQNSRFDVCDTSSPASHQLQWGTRGTCQFRRTWQV